MIPKVSVIVPVYNTMSYLKTCIDSILTQSFLDFELLLVDDGSTDDSGAICDDYGADDKRIRVFHKKNGGICSARNSGLDKARGEWLLFVDSDDWLASDAIQVLLSKQSQDDLDIVCGNRLIYEANGNYLWEEKDYLNKESFVLQMMQRTWDHLLTGKLIRHSLFTSNGLRWKEGLDLAEDRYMMTMLAYHAQSFGFIEDVVYHYDRRNANSITNAIDTQTVLKNYRQELGNILSLEEFFKGKEQVYQIECTRCVMEQLVLNLHTSLSCSDKSEFDAIVGLIDKRSEADLPLIGWKKKGVKGWIIHQFFFMKCYRRSIQFLKSAKKYLLAIIADAK